MHCLLTENRNKNSDAGGQHYGIPGAGGVVNQPGAVQIVGGGGVGADPINALQHLTKQPVPAGMTQSGGSSLLFAVFIVNQSTCDTVCRYLMFSQKLNEKEKLLYREMKLKEAVNVDTNHIKSHLLQ